MTTNTPERIRHFIDASSATVALKLKTIHGGTYAILFEATDFILRVGSIAILARLLIPEYFGLIGMVTAITTIVERVKDLGLATATVQSKDITHEQVSNLFWINAALGLGATIITLALAIPIVQFYGDARLGYIAAAIATGFLASGLAVQHQALLRRRMKFFQIGMIQVTSNTLSIAIAVFAAFKGQGYWALVYREVSRSVFMTIGTWLCCRWTPGAPSRDAKVLPLLKFGLDLTAVSLIYHFSTSLGQIVIGKLFGATSLGYYRHGYQLMLGPVSQLMYPINSVAESSLSRLQDAKERYQQYYRTLLSIVSFSIMPFVMFLTVFSEDVVLLILGTQWREAVPYFRLLGIEAFLAPLAATLSPVIVTCGFSRRLVWLGIVELVILAICFAIGSAWGPLGVVAGHVVASYLLFLPYLYWSTRDTPITLYLIFGATVWPILSSIFMGIALVIFSDFLDSSNSLIRLFSGGLFALTIYTGILAVIPAARRDVRIILTAVSGPFGWAKGASTSLRSKST